MKYVLGFAYSPELSQIALIQKNRPAWQAGRLNGIGGKVEPGETPDQAMAREFEEEAGCPTEASSWKPAGVIRGPDFLVYVYRRECSVAEFSSLESKTDEPVICVPIRSKEFAESLAPQEVQALFA